MRLLKLLEAKCACDRTNHMATTELEDKHISIRRLRDRDAAEQALAPDAAPRRQDRSNFGISMRSNVISVDRCGAGEAQGVGRIETGV